MTCPTQTALHSAASTLDRADALIARMTATLAREGWGEDELLREAVVLRRAIQKGAEMARREGMDVFNARRREKRASGVESLREIA